jgi:hypothetical protein
MYVMKKEGILHVRDSCHLRLDFEQVVMRAHIV